MILIKIYVTIKNKLTLKNKSLKCIKKVYQKTRQEIFKINKLIKNKILTILQIIINLNHLKTIITEKDNKYNNKINLNKEINIIKDKMITICKINITIETKTNFKINKMTIMTINMIRTTIMSKAEIKN